MSFKLIFNLFKNFNVAFFSYEYFPLKLCAINHHFWEMRCGCLNSTCFGTTVRWRRVEEGEEADHWRRSRVH